jgi:hypothetical protein
MPRANIMPESQGEPLLEKNDIVLIKARYVRQAEGVLTLKLIDGFGNAEVVAHIDSIKPTK